MRLDAIVTGARVVTLDDDRPTASRIGILHGRVVGLDDQLDGCTPDVVLDAGGAVVVPGLHDCHAHLSSRGAQLQKVDVSPAAAPTLADLYAAIRERATGLPDDAWVRRLLDTAHGVALLSVVKLAFVGGLQGGGGLVLARDLNSGAWSAPCAVGIAGLSVGAAVGGELNTVLLILNTKEALSTSAVQRKGERLNEKGANTA